MAELVRSILFGTAAAAELDPDVILGHSDSIVVKESVCYIVAGLLLRPSSDGDLDILLVQEAKASCHGKWYLPAGRLEPGESLEVGVKRELLEESGLECDVEDLLCVEAQGGGWYRFSFFCRWTGGVLKTTAQADKESLQADWFPVSRVLQKLVDLRSRDVLVLVAQAVEYFHRQKTPESQRPVVLPKDFVSCGMFLRLLILSFHANELHVLQRKKEDGTGGLPLAEYTLNHFFMAVVSKLFRELLVEGAAELEIPERCVALECRPVPSGLHDGLVLTLLVFAKPKMALRLRRPDCYSWQPVSDHYLVSLLQSLRSTSPKFIMH